MTGKEPPLHATPEALARAVLRPRPAREPEEVRVFGGEPEARRRARDLARTFPQVEVVPFASGYAILADGCPYLTNGQDGIA